MSGGYTEIFAWGNDNFGQLGLGDKEIGQSYSIPRFCSFNILIQQISWGEEHTSFITADGLVYSIGSNMDGRLGIGDKFVKHSSSPWLVELPTRTPASSISWGWGHTAVSLEDGSLYAWGLGDYGVHGMGDSNSILHPEKVPLPNTVKVAQVSCGSRHTAVVTFIGELWTCGSGESGQLGTGRRDSESRFIRVPMQEDSSSVSCGIFHTVTITSSGHVYTMGGNGFGQLGLNSKKHVLTPTLVEDLSDIFISKVAAGHHTAAMSDRGELYIWGSGIFGEFLAPQKVVSLNKPIKDIAIGGCFGAALDTTGTVWTWGSNASGELGVGDFDPRPNPYPILALQGKRVKYIACGGSFAIALG